jgi:hypothetical protein
MEFFKRKFSRDFAILAAGAAAFVLVCALAGRVGVWRLPWRLRLPTCPWRAWTGLPCPLCGMTRAICLATQCHFRESFLSQPAGFLIWLAGVAMVLDACASLVLGWSVRERAARRLGRRGWGVALAILGAAWCWTLYRAFRG